MASLLALLSSAMWGTADFFAGRLSKKHNPFAVLGFSQVFGLLVGVLIVVISGKLPRQGLRFRRLFDSRRTCRTIRLHRSGMFV